MKRRAKTRRGVRVPKLPEEQVVLTDLKYWLVHVLHWHALMFAVIGILVIGKTYF